MTDGKQAPDVRIRPSEAEITQLLQDAARQYEEYMTLADLADIPEDAASGRPRYAWDNPIGPVLTGRSNADVV